MKKINVKTSTTPGTVDDKKSYTASGEVVTWAIDKIAPGDLMRIDFSGTILAGFSRSAPSSGDKTVTIPFTYPPPPPLVRVQVEVPYSVYAGTSVVATDSLVIDTIGMPKPDECGNGGGGEPGEGGQGNEGQGQGGQGHKGQH